MIPEQRKSPENTGFSAFGGSSRGRCALFRKQQVAGSSPAFGYVSVTGDALDRYSGEHVPRGVVVTQGRLSAP